MHTIKRYSNRKLYDTKDKRYITLPEIAELVRAGEKISVVDNKSGADLTNVTLSQILLEQGKQKSTYLPRDFLANLIRGGGPSMFHQVREAMGRWLPWLSEGAEPDLQQDIDTLVDNGRLSSAEGKQLKDEVRTKVESYMEKIDYVLRERLTEVQTRLSIPSQADVDGLAERLQRLEERQRELLGENERLRRELSAARGPVAG